MAKSDKHQFEAATGKWELLHERGRYSKAPELGMTAVIFAQYEEVETEVEEVYKQVESVVFADEARRIADYINASGGNAFTIKGLTHDSLEEGVLKNDNVASVVVISHGNLSAVYGDGGNIIHWAEVADMTTHLKTGYFEQRFCGNFRRSLSVPFGLFAMAEARGIVAPAGHWFSPEYHPEHESLMRPVTTSARLTYKQIRDLFPKQPVEYDT
jgi:hypothetical protein